MTIHLDTAPSDADKVRNFIKKKRDAGFMRNDVERWLYTARPNGKITIEHEFGDVPDVVELSRRLINELYDPLAPILELNGNTSTKDVTKALREVAARMNGVDELTRLGAQEELMSKLRKLGITAPAKMLAAAFDSKDKQDAPEAGQTITIEDPQPWPDAVDGAALLQEIIDAIRRYVFLTEESAIAAALWVFHAHGLDAAFVTPFLCVRSPEKRCGKTTMLQVLGAITPRRMHASNVSVAALFRSIEKFHPTLLIDEADTFLRDNAELRGILNSGHTRKTAYVIRCVEPHFDAVQFSTWGAKIIALIGELKDTLKDRSIVITLRRKGPGELVEGLRADRLDELDPVCRKAWRWAQDNLDALRIHEPKVPTELHDRAADNWRSLLSIAEAIGGEWPERARQAAVVLSCRENGDSESIREMLLSDIRDQFETAPSDRLSSEDIVNHLIELENRTWTEFSHGRPISKNKLAKLLKPLDIQSRTIRLDDQSTAKGYRREDLEDAFTRYLPPAKRNNVTTTENIDQNAISKRNTESEMLRFESEKTPVNIDLLRCDVSKGGGRRGNAI